MTPDELRLLYQSEFLMRKTPRIYRKTPSGFERYTGEREKLRLLGWPSVFHETPLSGNVSNVDAAIHFLYPHPVAPHIELLSRISPTVSDWLALDQFIAHETA